MMKRVYTTWLLLILFTTAYNQEKSELKELWVQAESNLLYFEYEFAKDYYLILHNHFNDNANIQYKIGVCYLNIPDEKFKAIPYLEYAVQHTSPDANDKLFTEAQAPLDAYYYLGSAYLINNELDKALSTFEQFRDILSESKDYRVGLVNQAIKACEIAAKLEADPVNFKSENQGQNINIVAMNVSPTVSSDESMMVFTAKYGIDDAVFFSKKINGKWTEAIDITTDLGCNNDCASSFLSFDGKELYLYKKDELDGNIYVSHMEGGRWGKIQKLNKNINTKYYESHACVSKDGSTLYFTSNRKGGVGGLDIYMSKKQDDGEWGDPVNLGPSINTEFNETTPFITENDSLLYFASEGHNSIGGYDIFYAKRISESEWDTPENIGYPINTTDDDQFYYPVHNGKSAYYALTEGYKEKHVYKIDILPKGMKRSFEITGYIGIDGPEHDFSNQFMVLAINRQTRDTVDISYPNRSSGLYRFILPTGKYSLIYKGPGYTNEVKRLDLEENSSKSVFEINVRLKKNTTGDIWKEDTPDMEKYFIPENKQKYKLSIPTP